MENRQKPKVVELPSFLRMSDPPRSKPPREPALDHRRLYELWFNTGVLRREPKTWDISRDEFYGILSLVAMLAFCLGYYVGS